MSQNKHKMTLANLKRMNAWIYMILGILLIILGMVESNYNLMILGALSYMYSEMKSIAALIIEIGGKHK